MFSVAELLTHFHEICTDVENLALKSVNNINLPVCGSLTQLTSMDCFNLLVNAMSLLLNNTLFHILVSTISVSLICIFYIFVKKIFNST